MRSPLFARVWRRLMWRTTVIAITGSVGKTTAKEALAAILSARGPTIKTSFNNNDRAGWTKTLSKLRPRHRYAVIEIGSAKPGHIRRGARLVQPDVALILCVARQHTQSFPTLDATAVEKATLLEYLTRQGVAVLNADDDHVRAMAPPRGRRTTWFGTSERADVRLVAASAAWPERLSVTVEADGRQVTVETDLVGRHWWTSILAAMAAARVLGVPMDDAAEALRGLAPFNARLQPVTLPNGAIVLRDEYNGSTTTLETLLEVMRESTAARRVLVFSDVSHSREKIARRLRRMGQIAAELTGLAVFIGGHAHHAVKGAIAAGMDPAYVHDVVDIAGAAEVLRRELRSGDLVFLKGRMQDHLSRVLFAQLGAIGCWKAVCGKREPCEFCRELNADFDLRAVMGARAEGVVVKVPSAPAVASASDDRGSAAAGRVLLRRR